ncbi:MAG: hypothetical protein DHS20C18_30960 [Saprospiraceae bacterium]|nr:MAG: hypothetical protein DHS20C18_30960 [Saprospiraceae bacterium]
MKNHQFRKSLFSLVCCLCFSTLFSQQVPDTSFTYPIKKARYSENKGPIIYIDGAHHNFHTIDGRYQTFANVVAADGYQMKGSNEAFSKEVLSGCRILVISNPLHESNQGNWNLPTPSAFTEAEIKAVKEWVKSGGRLFLIADHMPFGGATYDLGKAFGVEWSNGFAMDNRRRSPEHFTRENGLLLVGPITEGQNEDERIDDVVTFTGSAFQLPKGATPILQLDQHYTLLEPEQAWQFEEDTPFKSGSGWYQAAHLTHGKGKVVVFGEAAMFSAQLGGPNQRPFGMNEPEAKQNPQLLLNIIHWLDEGK